MYSIPWLFTVDHIIICIRFPGKRKPLRVEHMGEGKLLQNVNFYIVHRYGVIVTLMDFNGFNIY